MTKIKENLKEYLLIVILVFFGVLFILNGNSVTAVKEGVSLWGANVLPALFPYLFITAILSKLSVISKASVKLYPLSKRLFNTGGITLYAYIISLTSGYPVGIKTVSNLYNNGFISKTEVYRCCAFCSTPSPVFLILSVGDVMFNNRFFGTLLFLTQLFSSFIMGLVFSFYDKKSKPKNILPQVFPSCDNVLYESVFDSVISILIIGGLITVFYLINYLLSSFNILNPVISFFNAIFHDENVAKGITSGLLETTCGLKNLSFYSGFWALPIASFLCGFGGLSIIFQQLAYLKTTKIKTAVFVIIKLLTAVTCFLFGVIFSIFL